MEKDYKENTIENTNDINAADAVIKNTVVAEQPIEEVAGTITKEQLSMVLGEIIDCGHDMKKLPNGKMFRIS